MFLEIRSRMPQANFNINKAGESGESKSMRSNEARDIVEGGRDYSRFRTWSPCEVRRGIIFGQCFTFVRMGKSHDGNFQIASWA